MSHAPRTDLDVHGVDLRLAPGEEAEARALLSGAERAHADRLARPEARRRYVAARAALREHLGAALGVPPAHVRLRAGARGRPEVEGADGLAFSLSHAGELAVVAVRRGGPVGIDVERLARRVRAGPVLARMSAPAERAAAEAEAEHRGAPAVLERWVAKEAVVKALGRGLSLPLAQVVLERDAEGRLELVELCGSAACAAAWELRAVAVEDGFVAAAALAR